MFKTDENSEMSPKKFGVGSIIGDASNKRWLVVAAPGERNKIIVIDLNTFKAVGWAEHPVSDLNYMTEKEVRMIVDSTVGEMLQWTFTDFVLDPKGLK